MKWIRWDGNGHFDVRNDKPVSMTDENYSDTFTDYDIVCEKDVIWREIESGTLNTEDGKLHITLKPLPTPEKVPTLVEAAKHYLETGWHTYRSYGLGGLRVLDHTTDIFDCAVQLAEAIEREENKSPNPYTSEAVDGFIDTISKYPCWLNDSQPGAYWSPEGRSAWDKLQSLLRQREAANV